eukprot:365530-Chlamydomonas_euryale.AAC.15
MLVLRAGCCMAATFGCMRPGGAGRHMLPPCPCSALVSIACIVNTVVFIFIAKVAAKAEVEGAAPRHTHASSWRPPRTAATACAAMPCCTYTRTCAKLAYLLQARALSVCPKTAAVW